MAVFIVDNYDSFTYNLVHYVEQIDSVTVKRYHEIRLSEIDDYDRVIISPGPGVPSEYPLLREIILNYARSKMILGICLGHEAIAEAYGASLRPMGRVIHGEGIKTTIKEIDKGIFKGLPEHIITGRYHSWCIDSKSMKDTLQIIANDEFDSVAAIKHHKYKTIGMQFHPESILTEFGMDIIENWINLN